METRLCVVQFLHPGAEPRVDPRRAVDWNTGGLHSRKFLRVRGTHVAGLDGESEESELVLWGEWEPQSDAKPLAVRAPGEPAWLHEPWFDAPPRGLWAQNTDPFVFGDHFLYTGCQQHRQGRPTQLARLRPGSVILFGSGRGRRFVLDTVFVAGPRWIDHSRQTLDRLDGRISDAYREITIDRWYAPGDLSSTRMHRLYFGAAHDRPVGGMFSFFPCLPYDGGGSGFARPEIRLPGYVTPAQTQSYRREPVGAVAIAAEAWGSVVDQVLAAGLRLGVRAEVPPRRTTGAWAGFETEAAGCAAA